jgi:hypothetical protein
VPHSFTMKEVFLCKIICQYALLRGITALNACEIKREYKTTIFEGECI